jgi:hypothetical protein
MRSQALASSRRLAVNRHALQQFIYVRDDSFPATSAASSAGTPPVSARNGHATVQNLMQTIDAITANPVRVTA